MTNWNPQQLTVCELVSPGEISSNSRRQPSLGQGAMENHGKTMEKPWTNHGKTWKTTST